MDVQHQHEARSDLNTMKRAKMKSFQEELEKSSEEFCRNQVNRAATRKAKSQASAAEEESEKSASATTFKASPKQCLSLKSFTFL